MVWIFEMGWVLRCFGLLRLDFCGLEMVGLG